jgi:CRISPR-associated endoribonuclease Cas6
MRLKINFTRSNVPVPINNQHVINGFVHRCLGTDNQYHDKVSNYCISNLRGGKLNKDKKTLSFNNGGFIVVASNDMVFIDKFLSGLGINEVAFYDMKVIKIEHLIEDSYSDFNIFRTLTPIVIKERGDKNYKFITINDEDYVTKLKNHMIKKISKIDPKCDTRDFDVKIRKHPCNKTKLVMIKNVKNVGSLCDIIINCNKKVANIIYDNGIGQSTGSGFGMVYNPKNHHRYYNIEQ